MITPTKQEFAKAFNSLQRYYKWRSASWFSNSNKVDDMAEEARLIYAKYCIELSRKYEIDPNIIDKHIIESYRLWRELCDKNNKEIDKI